MPPDHSERIAELEAELAQIEAAIENGHPEKSRNDLIYERSQTMRRIAQRRQDEEAKEIAVQQAARAAAAAERAEYDRLHPREDGEYEEGYDA